MWTSDFSSDFNSLDERVGKFCIAKRSLGDAHKQVIFSEESSK